jgi:hypothetical protein
MTRLAVINYARLFKSNPGKQTLHEARPFRQPIKDIHDPAVHQAKVSGVFGNRSFAEKVYNSVE